MFPYTLFHDSLEGAETTHWSQSLVYPSRNRAEIHESELGPSAAQNTSNFALQEVGADPAEDSGTRAEGVGSWRLESIYQFHVPCSRVWSGRILVWS